jgi:hypothetical protein
VLGSKEGEICKNAYLEVEYRDKGKEEEKMKYIAMQVCKGVESDLNKYQSNGHGSLTRANGRL